MTRAFDVVGMGLLTVSVVAGCASPRPSALALVTPLPAMPSPSGVVSPSATDPVDPPASAPASASPSGPPATAGWGPLAVIPPQDGSDTARFEGTLRITETCAFLDERGQPVLLLWPADRTRWDAGERTVTFENVDGKTVVVRDGTAVVLGGGGDSSEESGIAPEAWLESMTWVARPADGCPIDPWWGVGELALD